MYIQRFEIFGYGKWVDQSFQLTPNLNVFSGLNGSGKNYPYVIPIKCHVWFPEHTP